MISYRNKTYESEQALCQAYQYSYSEFLKYKEQGMALPEIMITLAPTNNRVIVYDGTAYANLTEFCNALGLDYYRYRSKFGATHDMEQAIEYARTKSVPRDNIVINGEVFRSYMEMARKYNISYASFMSYIHTKGKTPEEALEISLRHERKAYPVTYHGKRYPSILSLCRDYDWNYDLMGKLLKNGISVEAAAQRCEEEKGKGVKPIQQVEYKGKSYRSLHALARELGLTYSALYTSINNGKDLTAAVDDMLRRRADPAKQLPSSMCNAIGVTVRGVKYQSIKEALAKNNINMTSYYARKSANPDRSPEDILTELTDPEQFRRRRQKNMQVFEINGQTFGTQQEVYRFFGLAQSAVINTMRTEKLDFTDAVKLVLKRREQGLTDPDGTSPDNDVIILCGSRFTSLSDAVEAFGLKEEDITAYMEEHCCRRKEAVRALAKKIGPVPIVKKAYVIDGEPFPNKRSVYERYNISAYLVSRCMKKMGLTFEEAVTYLRDTNQKKLGNRPTARQPVTVKGISYPSVTAALQYLGLSSSSFYQRKKADPELTDREILEDMMTEGEGQGAQAGSLAVTIDGQTFPNRQSCLNYHGLRRHDVCVYMRKHTASFPDAIRALRGRRPTI